MKPEGLCTACSATQYCHEHATALAERHHRRDEYGRAQWALDNIYTIAIREERYGGERAKAWAHVRRICERFGCAVRAVRPALEPPPAADAVARTAASQHEPTTRD